MTAGGGILHQEMPLASPRMLGLQLWINLPAKHKMVDPKYRDITAPMVPHVTEEGVSVAVVAGRYKDVAAQRRATMWTCVFWMCALSPARAGR